MLAAARTAFFSPSSTSDDLVARERECVRSTLWLCRLLSRRKTFTSSPALGRAKLWLHARIGVALIFDDEASVNLFLPSQPSSV